MLGYIDGQSIPLIELEQNVNGATGNGLQEKNIPLIELEQNVNIDNLGAAAFFATFNRTRVECK